MNGTSRNSVANPPSQASTSRKTPQDKTIPDPMMNLKTDYFSQTPNNQLPYFFADFIKSPHSFGLSKEITKPNEYFVNTSYEQGLEVSSSPKLPYFLKQGSIHQKQKPTISKDPQSCDVIPRIDTSYAASSPPRSFAHFNNLREANRSPDFHKTDFFDAPVDSRLPRAKSSSQNETPIRSGASSTAYTGAMKALQEQIKDFNEKIKELETENECLKSFQREQIRKIEADYHAKIDEYRCSSRNIQDGLDTLEMGTIKLSESKKELEEKMDEMSKENKRLREEKALLKKKLKSMKEDNRFRQETVEEMSKMVREAKEETRGTEDSHKSEMKKMEEEAAGLRKESEELKEKNKSLAEKLGQLEKELKGNKKTYSQHIQQLSLTSEALKLDNQEMKEIYGGQLESFKSELEAIHESYTKRINSYEGMVADLSKENSKFKELIALKNREIESLKARTVEYNPLKEDVLVKSLGPEEYLLKDSLFDKSKWSSKNSKHIETSLINKSIVSKIEAPSTIQHSPSEMQRYARRLLTEGDASNRSSVKVSFNYTNLSLEPMRDKNEEVLENGKNSPANTLVTNRISTCESWNMNKQQLAERKEEENNRGNDLIAKEDELSLSSILTENNSFSRKEKAKKALVVENFKSRLSNLSNKFALSSEETNRRQSNPRYSNFLTDTDRNNSSSRDHIQTYKKFSKASTSNFSFGEIPKSFRQFGNEENGTQRSSYASPRGF